MHRHAIVPLADRITSSGYAYDDAGALTADPTRTYSYDGFGRLASTTVGSTTTSYTLDGAGNRLAETTGATTTSFDLDLRNSTPTILDDGSRRYLPGDPSAGYDQGGTWWSALTDLTGSAQSYVSQGGSQSAITRYDPFGAARPGSSVGTGIGFAGEWRDPAGLINLRTRAYDPVVGRFTSRDTLTGLGVAPQTANRYSYALNGPYRYADPSGHFANALYANRFAITSFILAVNPVTMVPYGLFLAVSGVDPFTGHRLSDGERFLAALPALGKVLGALSRTADVVSDASRLGKAGMAEEAGGLRGAEGRTLFRGTSEGFPGGRALQRLGLTPTSTDPVVATLFATHAEQFGEGVVQIARPADLAGVGFAPSSSLAALEREVVVAIPPMEFATRASARISASEARRVLSEIGVSHMPGQLSTLDQLQDALKASPRLDDGQIEAFIRIVSGE